MHPFMQNGHPSDCRRKRNGNMLRGDLRAEFIPGAINGGKAWRMSRTRRGRSDILCLLDDFLRERALLAFSTSLVMSGSGPRAITKNIPGEKFRFRKIIRI